MVPGTFYAQSDGKSSSGTDGGMCFTSSTPVTLPAGGSSAQPIASFKTAGELWLPLSANGTFHSIDAGIAWAQLGAGIAANNITASLFSVGAGPSASTTSLYLWSTVSTGGATGLCRSNDGGVTWVKINDDNHRYGGPVVLQGDSQVYGRVYLGMNGRGIVYGEIANDKPVNGTGVLAGTVI